MNIGEQRWSAIAQALIRLMQAQEEFPEDYPINYFAGGQPSSIDRVLMNLRGNQVVEPYLANDLGRYLSYPGTFGTLKQKAKKARMPRYESRED